MSYPDVDTWERTHSDDAYFTSDGKNLIMNLAKAIPNSMGRFSRDEDQEGLKFMRTFIIERKLFFRKTDLIAQYLDYFCEYFDEDKELIFTYMSIKEIIDSSIDHLTTSEFLKLLFGKFITETSIKKNIYRMVEENYRFDVTIDPKTGRSFNGLYDFNNDEAKALLAVSIFMKIVIPVTSHYVNTTNMYVDEELENIVTDVFVESIYSIAQNRKVDADEMMIKLYTFAEKKIIKHYGLHNTLWNQQCAMRGLTESAHIDTILIKHLLSNNMFKFKFDNNIISFLKSIVETQLMCTINKLKYRANPVRIDDSKNYNGLSGEDKLEQSMAKIDETSSIRCRRSIQYELNKMADLYGEISQEEHDYYMTNYMLNEPFHKSLVDYFYANEFGGYSELKAIDADQYCDFMIYCKKTLKSQGYTQLPDLISSNLSGKMTHRLLQNVKYIQKCTCTRLFDDLNNNKYKYLKGYNDTATLDIQSKVLNNVFTYVDYDDQEKTGQTIDFNEDIISDELLSFIDMI